MIMAWIQSKLKSSGEAFPDWSSLALGWAQLCHRVSGWQGLAVPWLGHTLCLCASQKGPRSRQGRQLPGAAGAQAAQHPLPSLCARLCQHSARKDSSPTLPWDASGIKVPHSLRVCYQLSAQHPFSSSLWKLPVPGLCFAWVLRRGSSSKGVFVLGFAVWVERGKSPSPLAEHVSVLPQFGSCLKTGKVFWQKQPGCVGKEIYNNCFPPFPLLTSSCCVPICGTIALDCK